MSSSPVVGVSANASAAAAAVPPAARRGQDGAPRNISTGSRPYRSHKVRACDLCRKRKSRCTVDLPGQSCLLCRIQGAECHYREEQSSPQGSTLRRLSHEDSKQPALTAVQADRKRKHDQIAPVAPTTTTSSSSATGITGTTGATSVATTAAAHQNGGNHNHFPTAIGETRATSSVTREESHHTDDNNDRAGLGESLNESVHIVGPVAAEDAQVIEKFMPSRRRSLDKNLPYNVYSNDPRNPILYTTVSRRRQGLRATGTPGESQLEILEQILGPFKHDLVNIYLGKINASFPIFDEIAFVDYYKSGNENLPPPLMCQVYATALVYWSQYHVLAPHPKPDIRYAVNLAVAALHEDFSAPGMSTLSSSLIDLTGRSVFSMTGNAINSGRTVALSHCLGLNRDPRNWKLSQSEKNHRIRLWWGVAIHDRWASYSHGVPPQIWRNQYDVPIPTIDVLVPRHHASQERVKMARCYIALCQLTEILGDLLPLVYGLQTKLVKETSKTLRRLRADLDSWEDSLPEWLKPSQRDNVTPISGSSNLHLAFLSLKMLVSRVELQEINNSETPSNPEARRYFQTECRKAAEEIVQFMMSLKKPNFQEFWMPYSAYHLTSAATLLVRCALETTDPAVSRSCLSNVDVLQDVLRRARSENDWDIADMCLDHCERILSKHPAILSDERPGTGSNREPSDAAAALTLPETLTNNDIVDDMMSISGAFGTMDGFPFDMTGIWDISGLQDQDSNMGNPGAL